jgi:hypothetical protein
MTLPSLALEIPDFELWITELVRATRFLSLLIFTPKTL